MYCSDCANKMIYDERTDSYACMECEKVVKVPRLTRRIPSATMGGRRRGSGFSRSRTLAVTRS